MKVILGIGNPGKKYQFTRHNVGFQILDAFGQNHNLTFRPAKSDFYYAEGMLSAFRFFLIKPTTYVNNTGIIIKELIDDYNLHIDDLLVIYDDTNLELGKIRIRKSGSDGGHNGIKSIIYNLESQDFNRVRVGISRPDNSQDLADFVLSEFSEEDNHIIEEKLPTINNLIASFIVGGIDEMLKTYSIESKKITE